MVHHVALLALLAAGSHTHASQARSALRAELQPLAFLVGSCWTGAFPDGKSRDTHCYEAVYAGQFVRDRHVVRGGTRPYEGETIYAWDPKQKRIVFTYWNSDGGISTGVVEPGDGEIVFPEAHADGSGQMTLKTVWTLRDADTYDSWVAQFRDGQWREMWRMTMRREKG